MANRTPFKSIIKDVVYQSFLSESTYKDSYGDRQIYASTNEPCKIEIFDVQNNEVQIFIGENILFQGIAFDQMKDHLVYTASNMYADKGRRKNWVLDHKGNNIYTVKNCQDGSSLFVGRNLASNGKRQLFTGILEKQSNMHRALFRITPC